MKKRSLLSAIEKLFTSSVSVSALVGAEDAKRSTTNESAVSSLSGTKKLTVAVSVPVRAVLVTAGAEMTAVVYINTNNDNYKFLANT